ncbi:MAG: GHKL domain-containing protein [Limosilactobacillus ingluviei]|nr:GHKL domain-containing protein [Limosilactobacillus ingluviei]
MLTFPGWPHFILGLLINGFPLLLYRLLFSYPQWRTVLSDFVVLTGLAWLAPGQVLFSNGLTLGYLTWLETRRLKRLPYERLTVLTILFAGQMLLFSSLGYFLRFFNWPLTSWQGLAFYAGGLGVSAGLITITQASLHELITRLTQALKASRFILAFVLVAYGAQVLIDQIALAQGVAGDFQLSLLVIFVCLDLLALLTIIALTQGYEREIQLRTKQAAFAHQLALLAENNQRYAELRRERHDLKNLLLSIQGYLARQQVEPASALLSQLLDQQSGQLIRSAKIDQEVAKLPLLGLQYLIQNKAYQLVNPTTLLAIEIAPDTGPLPVTEMQLVRLCGILLDNAHEAVRQQTHAKVQIAWLKHGNNYEFTVTNSLTTPVAVNQIFKEGYSTKGKQRGLGLATVEQLVQADEHLAFEAAASAGEMRMSLYILGES